MGDALDGSSLAHNVWVNEFTCEENLVRFGIWREVADEAVAEYGYAFKDGDGLGKADDHPVHTVTWHDAIKWCNARSEVEGVIPCYVNGATGDIYRTGVSDSIICHWDVPGYRLLSEAEWEKLARGGVENQRFPNGNEISQDDANYLGQPAWAYDKGPAGYNPKYANDPRPYTSPVGSFAPNGFGAFDMAGNLAEWCWDWFDYSYYENSPDKDPRGPDTGTERVVRSGSWSNYSPYSRVAVRSSAAPDVSNWLIGFRCVQKR